MSGPVVLLSTVGSPLLGPALDAFASSTVDVAAVVMDAELSARDRRIVRSRLDPTYEIAELPDFHYPAVPFYFVRNHQDPEALELLARLAPAYLVNAGTPRILKGEILTRGGGVLNCHPGLLPRYRGCTCVEWAIHHGDPVGATVHFMTEGIDEGPIVLSEALPVPRGQPLELIRTRMLGFSASLLVAGVEACLREGRTLANAEPQPEGRYFRPIAYPLLLDVKQKLLEGRYECPGGSPRFAQEA